MAHAAFFGLGAYTSALVAVRLGLNFFPAVVAGVAVAALISFIVSLPSVKLEEDYFVIATFSFQMILASVFNNWETMTRGTRGIVNIPPPKFFGVMITSKIVFSVLVLCVAALAYSVVFLITSSPFGRVLRAIRENEIFAKSVGKNTLAFKVTAFAISAALAGLAGGLFAFSFTAIDPTTFTLTESILVVSMVILGGAGSRLGPMVGAAILVIIPELLRFVRLEGPMAANLRQVIYGSLLIIVIMFRPRGLVGRYGFGR